MSNPIRSVEDAVAAGRAARSAGVPRTDCPFKKYPVKGLKSAWLEGWDSAVVTPEANVTTRRVEIKTRGFAVSMEWPDSMELPPCYVKPRAYPCQLCRALYVRDENGVTHQAVRTIALGDVLAYFDCRACSGRFKLRVDRSGAFPGK